MIFYHINYILTSQKATQAISLSATNLYEFETEKALYQKVEEFAYVDYNHVRPHSFNDYRTPYEARMAA